MSTRVLSMSPERYAQLRASDEPVPLIDVRTAAEYRAGHIPGAHLLPLGQLDPSSLEARLGEAGIGRDQTVYLTCHSGARAQQAVERLRDAGFHHLALIQGGTSAWEQAGLPLTRCRGSLALERQVQIALGTLLVLKVVFGFAFHELFFVAAAFLGAGLIVAGLTRWCGMARLLAAMPWNRAGKCPGETPS